ncbi:MAG: class II aldolase/adducin family protein [Caldilineales bacterium]|nr:class II aldolase/adducin family protein [Caldilineales bacterium]
MDQSLLHEQKRNLILLGRELVERGLVLGSGGNLSLRQNDTILISRSGSQLHQLTLEDFLPVALHEPYSRPAESPRPSLETPMHLAAYRARPEARVVIHCHPVHAIAWAMQGRDLPACTPDFAVYLRDCVPNLPYDLPGTEKLATAVQRGLTDHFAVLLSNHGVLVTGDTVVRARMRTLQIDETAHICLLATAAGALRPLSANEIAEILANYG